MFQAGHDSPLFEPPPHLVEERLVDYELRTALSLQGAVKESLRKLKKKTGKEQVHKSRVALRRWFSVWSLLEEEGWQCDEFQERQIKPLRRLLKAMGKLRDLDVCTDKCKMLGASDRLIRKLKRKRKRKEAILSRLVDSLSPVKLTQGIAVYLHKKAPSLGKTEGTTPYALLDKHVQRQEEKVRKLARKAATAEEPSQDEACHQKMALSSD